MKELLGIEDFRNAVSARLPILDVDVPTVTEVLHRQPQDCSCVEEKWFTQKVIDNARSTGGYFAVRDERAARLRWPQISLCKRCS